ncbi:S9 family peptidase [Spirosoma taeanense]|uniref:Acyl-peptide hydrolase n=2 Tax=Spirosoma taeanense TaxID=2735870 RepID=A0A6M5YDS6_9BACT|nr:S9 family peptidase [Spirosoma taeanense]
MNSRFLLLALLTLGGFSSLAQTSVKKRPLTPRDIYRLQTISDLQVSPDGKWVAYGLSTVDSTKDKRNTDIWMVSWNGQESVQLTNTPEGESKPRFSPDGKYLSFVSARQGATKGQIWLMDRRGGEARKLTDLKNDLEDYVWSPDGKKIAMVLRDVDYADSAKTKVRKPYVLDRYHFKADVRGYLENSPVHLYVFDVTTKKLDTLTTGIYDETSPVWSPDGSQIAFVSNRTQEPDRNQNTDIYVIDARKGAAFKQLTTWTGSDNSPAWSPDGKTIAYLRSTASGNFLMYDQPVLAVISREGGEPALLSKTLDRPVRNPHWTKDGQAIGVLIQDDRQAYVGQYTVATGKLTKLTSGNRAFSDLEAVSANNWATLMSDPQTPPELYAVENGITRRLTHVHDAFLAPLELAQVEGFTSRSKDGAQVSNILYRPANAPANKKLPTILYIHGGPVSQDEFSFDLTRQLLAAGGYAVVAVNYRGSNGRGIEHTKAIYADWGNKEVLDILGATDYVVEKGIADPERLGIGGWSYGGILTNYTIATDTRFKAAASGAGSSLQLSMYGIDQYTNQYENELGAPWKNTDKWLKLSYPFLKADRIKTPTIFMAGEKDFNVPSAGSEQMFQALRSLGIPTQLIIYPGQFHGITVPSYQKDRADRYLQWFDKYLKPKTT